jgi:hypothetical protein
METDDNVRHAQIETRAYTLWMESGQPEGRAEDFWHLAKAEIESEDVGVAGDEKGGGMMMTASDS